MASRNYILSIGLQRLQTTYTDHGYSFICYAAGNIVSNELADKHFGDIDSDFFWAELHRLNPELFCRPTDLDQEQSAVIEQWFNPECFNKFEFIKNHVNAKLQPGSIRAFRIQLLALLVERHGPDTVIPFKFTIA